MAAESPPRHGGSRAHRSHRGSDVRREAWR
jgi:hypothetical protein